MRRFDDALPRRRVDNFQFVQAPVGSELHDPEAIARFSLGALQELPQLWEWLGSHTKFGTVSDTVRDAALEPPVRAKDYGAF